MSWALVATAAAGLNAGAGLSASLVERASVEQPLVLDAYRAMLKATSANKIALSNTLATLSAGAALSAYFAGGDNPDPAWITCALVTGAIPLFNLLVLSPAAKEVPDSATSDLHTTNWQTAFGVKSWMSTGLSLAAFGCMLLVLGYGQEVLGEGEKGRNPLRFR